MTAKSATESSPPFPWKEAIKFGLYGGVGMVLVSVIGMVETFGERDIISGVITMGQSLLLAFALLTAYMAANRLSDGNKLKTLGAGVLSGITSAALLAGLVWMSQAIDVRNVLVNVSPGLIKILTFERPLPDLMGTAILMLLGSGAIAGLMGGLLRILSVRLRNAIVAGLGWVAVIGLISELLRIVLVNPVFTQLLDTLLGGRSQEGIATTGAFIVFVLIAAIRYAWPSGLQGLRTRVTARRQALPKRARLGLDIALFVIAFLVIWQLPAFLGLYLSDVANNIGLFLLMGLGLNIVVGFAGLLDLGYVAFFAIGAYTMAVATSGAVGAERGQIVFSLGWSFWEALPLAIGIAMLAGIILGIPVLKMRGDYLAIVTLGFGEIIRILAISDWLKPNVGGSQGIVQIAPIIIAGENFSRPTELFHIVFVACIIVGFVALRLRASRPGRAWKAIREDEDVAEAMGVNLVRTKLLAFAAGAAFSGLAGAIFASKLSSIIPGSFSFQVSINILALIIIGGMGSIPGVLIGALVLVGVPELLREFDQYRLLVFGAVLVMMMLLKPEGLAPEETHKLELHAEENVPAAPAA